MPRGCPEFRPTRLPWAKALLPNAVGGAPQTYKPGSVSFLKRKNGDHLSSPSVCGQAGGSPLLAERRCRRGRAANPRTSRAPMSPYLALLQVGFSRRCVTADGRTLLPSDFTLILPSLEGRYVSVPLSVPDSGEPVIGAWALPSTLPSGARTFLPPSLTGRTAVTRSASPSDSHSSIGPIPGQTNGVSPPAPEDEPASKGKMAKENGRIIPAIRLDCLKFAFGEVSLRQVSGRSCYRGPSGVHCGPVAVDGWAGTSGIPGRDPSPP